VGLGFFYLPFFLSVYTADSFTFASFFPDQVEIQAIIIILDILHSSILKMFSEVGLLKSFCII